MRISSLDWEVDIRTKFGDTFGRPIPEINIKIRRKANWGNDCDGWCLGEDYINYAVLFLANREAGIDQKFMSTTVCPATTAAITAELGAVLNRWAQEGILHLLAYDNYMSYPFPTTGQV